MTVHLRGIICIWVSMALVNAYSIDGNAEVRNEKDLLEVHEALTHKKPQRIAVVNMYQKLGDMIITLLPLIHYLNSRYPEAHITLYSPVPDVFLNTKHFNSKKIGSLEGQLKTGKRLTGLSFETAFKQLSQALTHLLDPIYPEISKNADLMVLSTVFHFQGLLPIPSANTASGLDTLAQRQATMSVTKLILRYLNQYDTPVLAYPINFALGDLVHYYMTLSMKIDNQIAIATRSMDASRFTGNVYTNSELYIEYLSGSHSIAAGRDLKHYLVPDQNQSEVARQKLHQLGLRPNEYILLNIQGEGENAIAWAFFVLSQIVDKVVQVANRVDRKVALTHWNPEFLIHYFPSVKSVVDDIIEHIASIPDLVHLPHYASMDKLYNVAIEDSYTVVTLDTGFAHLSKAIKAERDVFTMMHEASELWQFPGRPYYTFRPKSPKHAVMYQDDTERHVLFQQIESFLLERRQCH